MTANNWEDQWLNYGLSTYAERFIQSQFHSFDYAQVEAYVGNTSMVRESGVYGIQNQTYSSLHPVLRGANPDEAFNVVAFEKGFQLIYYLESIVTDQAAVQDFFTFYVDYNNLMSICAFQYRHTYSAFVDQYYTDDDTVNQVLEQVDYEAWIYEVGNAPAPITFTNSRTTAAVNLADAYIALNGAGQPTNYTDYNTWESNQKVVFHQTLLWNTASNAAIMTAIDADLNITGTSDPEIKQRWFSLGIYVNYNPIFTPCGQWLASQSRNKFIQPIFDACAEAGGSQLTTCMTWYDAGLYFWSPLTITMVNQILGM